MGFALHRITSGVKAPGHACEHGENTNSWLLWYLALSIKFKIVGYFLNNLLTLSVVSGRDLDMLRHPGIYFVGFSEYWTGCQV